MRQAQWVRLIVNLIRTPEEWAVAEREVAKLPEDEPDLPELRARLLSARRWIERQAAQAQQPPARPR